MPFHRSVTVIADITCRRQYRIRYRVHLSGDGTGAGTVIEIINDEEHRHD